MGGGRGRVHHRTIRPPVLRAAALAGRDLAGIGRHRRLIFLLMVTYLYGLVARPGRRRGPHRLVAAHPHAAGFPAADSAYQAPAPGAQPDHRVPASAPGFSAIPPLAGDEDFGLDTGKDVTRIDALQAFTCVECGRCTEHCPAYNTGKVLNPKEIVLGLRGYLKEHGPAGEAPLLGRTSPKRRPSNAPPAAPANSSARWEFSTCP